MNELMNKLQAQEDELWFPSFTNEDALKLGLLICEIASDELNKGIAVQIENDEHPLFTHFMKGTSKDNVYWINAKKNVVKHFGHSSLYVGEMYRDMGTTFKDGANLPLTDYQGEGGSFPLILSGKGRIGTITVSGLTGEEDHALAVEGIKRFLKKA